MPRIVRGICHLHCILRAFADIVSANNGDRYIGLNEFQPKRIHYQGRCAGDADPPALVNELHASIDEPPHPLSEPLSKPLMMKRWKMRAKAMGGITEITPAVMMLTKLTSTSVAKSETTTVLV